MRQIYRKIQEIISKTRGANENQNITVYIPSRDEYYQGTIQVARNLQELDDGHVFIEVVE